MKVSHRLQMKRLYYQQQHQQQQQQQQLKSFRVNEGNNNESNKIIFTIANMTSTITSITTDNLNTNINSNYINYIL
jgi:Tfp pilus assembly protein PilV